MYLQGKGISPDEQRRMQPFAWPAGSVMPTCGMTPAGKMPGSGKLPGGGAMPASPIFPMEAYTALVRNIEKYMQDEATAAPFYAALAEEAAQPKVKEYLLHAREEEQKHYRLLQELYRELTGRTFEAMAQTVTFPTLREGLLRAIDDELNAYEEYADERLRHMHNDRIASVFYILMTDEIEHAVRFNTALHIMAGQS